MRAVERSIARIEAGGVQRQSTDIASRRDITAQLNEYRANQREIRKAERRARQAARVALPPDPVGENWDQEMAAIYRNAMDEL